jgi:hypothetical protein
MLWSMSIFEHNAKKLTQLLATVCILSTSTSVITVLWTKGFRQQLIFKYIIVKYLTV